MTDTHLKVYNGPDGNYLAQSQNVPEGWELRAFDDEDWQLDDTFPEGTWVECRPRPAQPAPAPAPNFRQNWLCEGVICFDASSCGGHPGPVPSGTSLGIINRERERLQTAAGSITLIGTLTALLTRGEMAALARDIKDVARDELFNTIVRKGNEVG